MRIPPRPASCCPAKIGFFQPEARIATSRTVLLALLLGVAAVNFIWMPGEFLSGDPHAWREETRSLLLYGELNVPFEAADMGSERGQYLTQNERNGLYYSKFGIANSLLALPPMWLERALGGNIEQRGRSPSLLLANLWNMVFSVALAALLYALSAAYSRRIAVRVLFVIGALYCTSLWFYQRAQSSEIYQTLFFTAFFMALIGFLRPLKERGPRGLDARAWKYLALVWLCAGLLVFIRVLNGLLLPLVVLLAAYCAASGRPLAELRGGTRTLGAALLLPPALIVILLGVVNHVKFGAPWLTGYHQWLADAHLPAGRLADGLWGLLFAPRFSMFLYFPLLVFALAGLRRFIERHHLDALVMLSIFGTFFLVICKIPSWAGEWTYGPRYLLPVLPLLSLPFLTLADEVLDHIGTWRARAWAMAAIATLAYSGYLQVQVNRLPFWTYYQARAALLALHSLEAVEYFQYRHTALIADDLVRHRDNFEGLPYAAELKRVTTPEWYEEYREVIGGMLERGNLYWALPPGRRR
jgi:hypothetical protein